jgi:hypothetical protein
LMMINMISIAIQRLKYEEFKGKVLISSILLLQTPRE